MAQRWHFLRFAGAALVGWLAVVPAAVGGKFSFSPDIFFAEDSAALQASELEKIDVNACKAAMFIVDGVVVIGHADRTERNAPALSKLRAERVASYIRALTGLRLFMEIKGASQPMADFRNPQGRAKNRRVEVEFLISVPDAPRPIDEPCLPQWQRQMLASATAAPAVARAWIRDYHLAADAPLLAALRLQRWDIFAALVRDAHLVLTPVQAERVAHAAVDAGQFDYTVAWAREHSKLLTSAQWSQTLAAICIGKNMNESQRLQAIQTLHQLGARSEDAKPLLCAVALGDTRLVDFYLQTDGTRFLTPDVVVAAGPHPAVLQQLIAAGGDLGAQRDDGSTLFHTSRLTKAEDVQALQGAGLDINHKRRDGATPMQLALEYAPLVVLEAMRNQGAQLDGIHAMEVAQRRPEVQIWLLESGVAVTRDDLVRLWPLWIKQGAASLPVLQSLQAHGVKAADGEVGRSALAQAIDAYQVELVRFLVNHGASQTAMTLKEDVYLTARERAAALQDFDIWKACMSSVPTKWCPPFHDPILNQERAQKKQAIVEILRSSGMPENTER